MKRTSLLLLFLASAALPLRAQTVTYSITLTTAQAANLQAIVDGQNALAADAWAAAKQADPAAPQPDVVTPTALLTAWAVSGLTNAVSSAVTPAEVDRRELIRRLRRLQPEALKRLRDVVPVQ